MNLQLDRKTAPVAEQPRNLWSDTRVWWINCLAIERYWFYAGTDLELARGRRDAMLSAIIERW